MRDEEVALSAKEIRVVFLKSAGITGIIMWLFYRSLWAIIFLPFVFIFVFKQMKQIKMQKRENQIKQEFLHGIGVLNASLQAGLSMENAWKEVERESKILYGTDSEFYLAIREINQRVSHNIPIEKLLLEFAYTSKVEDIIQFAELMEYGKRSGSNWKHIIDVCTSQMTECYETKQEIEVMIAEKKMEQQVMNIVPLGLLAFLQISAWDYMSVLYHNLFGVFCMTIFLVGYVVALILSQRILKVEI